MRKQYYKPRKKTPLIVICSEGGKNTSEETYFKNFKRPDLRIQFSSGNSTDSKGMLEDLINYIKNEDIESEDNCRIFLVLDTDLDDEKINMIKAIEKECKDRNIEIITSAPTFEIWYLMHFRDNRLVFSNSKEVKREIKTLIDGYRESTNVFPIINNWVDKAIKTAKSIETNVNNNGEDLHKHNPHTSVYKIIDAIDEHNNI